MSAIVKETFITVDGVNYRRFHVKTHVIAKDDDILAVAQTYAGPEIKPGDYLFISERSVAITQGRAYKISEIKVGFWAKFLTQFVFKSPYGIGLARPQTMQLAIREAGLARILLAAFCSAVTKPFGLKGVFYRVAGHGVNAIDGPCDYTLPPYNDYAVIGPENPDKIADKLATALSALAAAAATGTAGGTGSTAAAATDIAGVTGNVSVAPVGVVIIDANDLGVEVLGASAGTDKAWAKKVFQDNPLGQGSEQTPMAIVRREGVSLVSGEVGEVVSDAKILMVGGASGVAATSAATIETTS